MQVFFRGFFVPCGEGGHGIRTDTHGSSRLFSVLVRILLSKRLKPLPCIYCKAAQGHELMMESQPLA